MEILQDDTSQGIAFAAVDATDGKTRETGLTGFTVYYSISKGADVAVTTPTTTEIDATNMPGVYWLDIDEAGMVALSAGVDAAELVVHISHASMEDVTRTILIKRPKITAGETLTVNSSGYGDSNLHAVQSNTTVAAILNRWFGDGVVGTADSGTTTTMVDAALTSAVTDYYKGWLLVFSTGNNQGIPFLVTGFTPGSDTVTFTPAAPNAVSTDSYALIPLGLSRVWDVPRSGHTVQGSIGEAQSVIESGTVSNAVSTPTTTSIPASDITEATGDHFNDRSIYFVTGNLAKQKRKINNYVLTSGEGVFTTDEFTEAPANGDAFVIV